MQKRLCFVMACMVCLSVMGQPYIDPFNIRYTYGFKNGNKANSNATPFSHIYIGPDLPFKLRKKSLFVLSPFYDRWNIDSSSDKSYLPVVSSIGLAVTTIIPLDTNHWSLNVTAIPRINSQGLQLDNSFQMGGLVLAVYKKNKDLTYKFGVYVNTEFFGFFVLPLVGIVWKINDHNNLFGVLPGRLTYEHKLSDNFYTGATFRTITNSYRLNDGNYLRIVDHQLSAYLDFYATKHIVFTGEAGYGLYRELVQGVERNKNYLIDYNWADGMFIKLCASYRIRL